MYPRNAASPERIAIGAVVQISDGAVQTSGVSVTVTPHGGSESAGGGTVAYSARGVVWYTPTQAETDSTSFVIEAGKTGCVPVAQTIVTSASATPGYAGTDQSKIANPTATVDLSGTTVADTSGTTTLLSRLSATRAGYLDNLSGGAVALASTILDAAGIRSALGMSTSNLPTEAADALLGRNVAGGSSSGRTVKEALYFLRNKWTAISGTLTVYGTDDTTAAWTSALTQTAGNPVSASDPA